MLSIERSNQANKMQAQNMLNNDQDYVLVGEDKIMLNERNGTVFMYSHNGECDTDKFTRLYQVI